MSATFVGWNTEEGICCREGSTSSKDRRWDGSMDRSSGEMSE